MEEIYVFQSVLIAQIGTLVATTGVSWSSPFLPKLNSTDDDNPLGRKITDSEYSWLASLLTLGAMVGTPIFGIMASKFGRKPSLCILGFPVFLSYLMMTFFKNIWFFIIARFLNGISVGGLITVLPMYIGEVASPKNRGILGSLIAVYINIGMLLSFCLGPYIPFFYFHLLITILSALNIVLTFLFVPESPHYLIQNDFTQASNVLRKLRGSNFRAGELDDIQESIRITSEGSILDNMKNKAFSRAIIIGIGLIFFQVLTGNNVIVPFAQTICELAGLDFISPKVTPMLIGLAQLITTLIVSSIADRFRRKFLLIISLFGVAITLILLGIYFFLKDNGHDVSSISWLPVVSLIVYVIVYNIGVGPMNSAVLSEIYSPRVKGVAISILVVILWGGAFLQTLSYDPIIKNLIDRGVSYWIFAAICTMGMMFIHFFVIETKGKTLKEIQDELTS